MSKRNKFFLATLSCELFPHRDVYCRTSHLGVRMDSYQLIFLFSSLYFSLSNQNQACVKDCCPNPSAISFSS